LKKISDWFSTGSQTKTVHLTEATVREVVTEVINEIGLKRKVDSIDYRPKHHWYIVRFFSPPSCIIPRQHFVDYLKSDGKLGKKEIIEILSVKSKGLELI